MTKGENMNRVRFLNFLGQPVLLPKKLCIPDIFSDLVPRPSLQKMLDNEAGEKLTAVIAPAGFGKTWTVVDWLRQKLIPAGWVTLDSYDNEPLSFWTYLTAALGSALNWQNSFKDHSPHSKGSFSLELELLSLIQQLSDYQDQLILVLDDYHFISEPRIHETLQYFIKNTMSNLHIILLSRNRPFFLRPQLQLKVGLKEIGTKELSFSQEEISRFFRKKGIRLSNQQLQILKTRTDGWPVGIHFISEIIKDNRDISSFQDMWGDIFNISRYLDEEVFQEFTKENRQFLLHTSILEQLAPSLCNAVTNQRHSRQILDTLAFNCPFVVPPKTPRGCFSYNPLFREYLQYRLQLEGEELLPELHQRAADWYSQNGLISKAVQHFIHGGHYSTAVSLLEKKGPEMLKDNDGVSFLSDCIKILPAPFVEKSRMLSLVSAWTMLLAGRQEEAESWIQSSELLENKARVKQLSKDCLPSFTGEIGLARSFLELKKERIPNDLNLLAESCNNMPGESIFKEMVASLTEPGPGNLSGPLGFYGHLNLVDGVTSNPLAGELKRVGLPPGYLTLLRAELLYEWNQLENACGLVIEGMEEAQKMGTLSILLPAFFILARIHWTKGAFEDALQAVAEAEKIARAENQGQWLSFLAAFKTRLMLQKEETETVSLWLETTSLSIFDRPNSASAYEQTTLARVLLAEQGYNNALFLLNRLCLFVQKEQHLSNIIEMLNLEALVYLQTGEINKSLAVLEKSLTLGEKEGYLRSYIDEGVPMYLLLQKYCTMHKKQGKYCPEPSSLKYARFILGEMKKEPLLKKGWYKKMTNNGLKGELPLEPLTRREIQVLRLLAAGLSNKEIAQRLSIEVNTAKVYNRNIFGKLLVNNRHRAVEQARKLGIIEPTE